MSKFSESEGFINKVKNLRNERKTSGLRIVGTVPVETGEVYEIDLNNPELASVEGSTLGFYLCGDLGLNKFILRKEIKGKYALEANEKLVRVKHRDERGLLELAEFAGDDGKFKVKCVYAEDREVNDTTTTDGIFILA